MSGRDVPYQLRINKYVERQLFLDAIDYVRVWNGPSSYVYVSMGGKFLEDFRQVNERFAIEHMVSLEGDQETYRRQVFNNPLGFIECRHEMTSDFIPDFENFAAKHEGRKFIVWLDYAVANSRREQLQEYEELIAKLAPGDVVKITLNANPESKYKRSDFARNSLFYENVIRYFQDELEEYLPKGRDSLTNQAFKISSFPKLLAACIENAGLRHASSFGFFPIPLLACRYSDGPHQMMTVTAVIADEAIEKTICDDKGFLEWEFRAKNWKDVREISLPELSIRERLWINSESESKNPSEIHDSLGFQLGEDDSKSKGLIRRYLSHYRRYPSFVRVSV